ncbi:MAG: LysM peptidoglycan-binding domain-containing protein [Gammaproteobacteria bacterium]
MTTLCRILIVLAMMGVGVLCAAEAPFRDSPPERYVVKKGDTLWGIADTFLRDPWKWPEIWYANEQIENPHLIYPGDVIRMVYVNGKPRLTVDRADTSDLGNARTHMPNGTIKLSPRPRVSKLDSVIPAIPLDAVQSFLVDNRVVTETELDGAPYVVAGGDQRIVLGAGDKVYVRGKLIENQTAFGIYRKGAPFKDPDTGELLGWEAKQLGLSKLISIDDEISTLRLLNTNKDIRVGDRLLPTIERKVESVFYPRSPEVDIQGKIIHVFGGVRNVSQYNVVVLNRGERDSVAVGDVLAIFRKGERVRDRFTSELLQLPSERAGLLIIFRTFEKVSFGLVLKAQKTLKVFDVVKNP